LADGVPLSKVRGHEGLVDAFGYIGRAGAGIGAIVQTSQRGGVKVLREWQAARQGAGIQEHDLARGSLTHVDAALTC